MEAYHKWKPVKHYVGPYTDPETETTYTTCLHDVQCTECKTIVTLPDTLMPAELGRCTGRAAEKKEAKTGEDASQFLKDGQDLTKMHYPKRAERGKVHQLRANSAR